MTIQLRSITEERKSPNRTEVDKEIASDGDAVEVLGMAVIRSGPDSEVVASNADLATELSGSRPYSNRNLMSRQLQLFNYLIERNGGSVAFVLFCGS